MAVIKNQELQEILTSIIQKRVEWETLNPVLQDVFMKDFSYRFCWSSNALEGNTLTLDETITLIEDDVVKGGHTFTEYQDAKMLHYSICKMLLPFKKKEINEEWVKAAHALLMEEGGEYRTSDVYVGSQAEAVYFPPTPERVNALMQEFMKNVNLQNKDTPEFFTDIVTQHIEFECIHPFKDGNGRTGRMIYNQQLINNGFLPITINPSGKYRQAFRIYNRNKDISLMKLLFLKAEYEAIERIENLQNQFDNRDE